MLSRTNFFCLTYTRSVDIATFLQFAPGLSLLRYMSDSQLEASSYPGSSENSLSGKVHKPDQVISGYCFHEDCPARDAACSHSQSV